MVNTIPVCRYRRGINENRHPLLASLSLESFKALDLPAHIDLLEYLMALHGQLIGLTFDYSEGRSK